MRRPERGIACPGCPHRAAYVAVKEAMGRGRGRVYCGNAGCAAVGAMHPAATAVEGGEGALLPRYRQQVPSGEDHDRAVRCAHFVLDRELMAEEANAANRADAANPLDHLAREGETVLLCVLASSKDYLVDDAIRALAARSEELGAADVAVVDPFDTLTTGSVIAEALEVPGVHALIFSSPCAQLVARGTARADAAESLAELCEPAEVDRFACVACHRCKQITGCPALSFTPPVYTVDANACAGCDLCCDFCRTHVIYTPRQRLSPAERRALRLAAAGAGR